MPRAPQIPSYRLHRPSGRAVVTLNGKDHYLGLFDSPESKTAYQRVVGEWIARHHTEPQPAEADGLAIAEIMLAYLDFAQTYYRDAEDNTTTEYTSIKYALTPLESLYGTTLARDFGPAALKAVRQNMIECGWCRRVVNQRISHVKRMFKWASSEELIPATVFHGLACVDGLRRGRSLAKETDPVRPVPDAHVDAVLPFLTPTVRAMVELQRLTGMRSGELVLMRGTDLDTTGKIWQYAPAKHKTAHHGHTRRIPLGPHAQEILRPFLKEDPATYLFSPAQAVEERRAELRKQRKTKVQPSQVCRKKRRPEKQPRVRYDRVTYYRAIQYAIQRARGSGSEIGNWHPHQLRHNAATRIRKERGLDAARAVLGQKSLAIADTYAEIDAALASQVAAELG